MSKQEIQSHSRFFFWFFSEKFLVLRTFLRRVRFCQFLNLPIKIWNFTKKKKKILLQSQMEVFFDGLDQFFLPSPGHSHLSKTQSFSYSRHNSSFFEIFQLNQFGESEEQIYWTCKFDDTSFEKNLKAQLLKQKEKKSDKMNQILSSIFWFSLSVSVLVRRTPCIKYCSKVKRTTITAFEFFSCTLSISFSFFQSRASHVQFSRCAISGKTQARKFHFKLFRCRDRDNFYTSA